MSNPIPLCQNYCCPTVWLQTDGTLLVKDDFGGQVVLTREQFDRLYEAVKTNS